MPNNILVVADNAEQRRKAPARNLTDAGQTLSPRAKRKVADATFKIQGQNGANGQCVLIDGGVFITAAHCQDWDCTIEMAFDTRRYNSKIETGSGDLIATPLAVEPVADVAVLGEPHRETFENEWIVFNEFCESKIPIKLLRKAPRLNELFPVWIRTHLNTWISGSATCRGGFRFAYTSDEQIPCGTSGGPIVNQKGELVGVISDCTDSKIQGKYQSRAMLLPLALPVWVVERIKLSCHHEAD